MSAVQPDGGYDFVSDQVFENTFTIADIATLDDETLSDFVACGVGGMTIADIGLALHDAPSELVERFIRDVSATERADFTAHIRVAASHAQVAAAEQRLVDALFWELTYWKTPELYEELTEGELLHPGIFEKLGPELRDKVVLDAGAGTGRATFDCVRQGARQVYAVDPSPGLLRLLRKKIAQDRDEKVITPLKGRFDALPLDDASIDVTIACAAFTADDEHGAGGRVVGGRRFRPRREQKQDDPGRGCPELGRIQHPGLPRLDLGADRCLLSQIGREVAQHSREFTPADLS